MMAVLRWLGSIAAGAVNGIFKFALAIVILVFAVMLVGLTRGDGMPGTMVLTLDLRKPVVDSSSQEFKLGKPRVTVMDIVLGLDAAQRDDRVKGVFVRVGGGNLSVARAEEIGAALKRFRAAGKFVIVHAQSFAEAGLGDYLTAAAGEEIWMQPKSPFDAAGQGAGMFYLRGLLDKIKAEPQIVKRADFKSAASMFMEPGMTPADREQLTALIQSLYDAAVDGMAADRRLDRGALVAALEASPQFTEQAKDRRLIDRIGYDDDALKAALDRAGSGAKPVTMTRFVMLRRSAGMLTGGTRIALVEAAGDIVEGSAGGGLFGGDDVIAGDDMAKAIRDAAKDKNIRAIILRVDSGGGSAVASDQILDAVKKAQAAGKPVVVSMGSVAASGGYWIATSADKIVAEPGTITGSIGVLTGKIVFGNTLGLLGIKAEVLGVGRNALINSDVQPYTQPQLDAINAQADAFYNEFLQNVAAGRKLPLAKVADVAKGRVWSGTDASSRGLVDKLGGFWDAAALARHLANIPDAERVVFVRYPRHKGFFEALKDTFGNSDEVEAVENFTTLMTAPAVRQTVRAVRSTPRAGVELRAANLPQ